MPELNGQKKKKEKVSKWCFMPSQPLRSYQEEKKKEEKQQNKCQQHSLHKTLTLHPET